MLEPIDITLAGRATRYFRGVTIPVEILAVEHCRAWLNANLVNLGLPLNEPAIADISIRLADPASIELVEASCAEIVRGHLAIVHELWREIVTGRCAVC